MQLLTKQISDKLQPYKFYGTISADLIPGQLWAHFRIVGAHSQKLNIGIDLFRKVNNLTRRGDAYTYKG